MAWDGAGGGKGDPCPVPGKSEHFWPGSTELALGPYARMPRARKWGAGSQESSGRYERPGEIDLLETTKGAKYVCQLSDDSGAPQGSTNCEHQRIKDRPPPTRALPAWSHPSAMEGPLQLS